MLLAAPSPGPCGSGAERSCRAGDGFRLRPEAPRRRWREDYSDRRPVAQIQFLPDTCTVATSGSTSRSILSTWACPLLQDYTMVFVVSANRPAPVEGE